MKDILTITIPILTVFISVFGSFWVTTNQIVNNKATERISLLRREFADLYGFCAMIMYKNNVDDSIKLSYAKTAFHIVFLLNEENIDEKEMRELLKQLAIKIPQYMDNKGITRADITADLDIIGRKFDLIMKMENNKLRQHFIYKLIPFKEY